MGIGYSRNMLKVLYTSEGHSLQSGGQMGLEDICHNTITQQYNNETTRIPFKCLETRLEEGGDSVTPITLASILLGIEGKS